MTHFAISSATACGKSTNRNVYGMSLDSRGEGCFSSWDDFEEGNTQHTADPDYVTCHECKKTPVFKKALEESKEE
jgi:hypothetical protein